MFDSLVKHSGHSAIRVIMRGETSNHRDAALDLFRSRECSWEFTNVDLHFAVDVPENVDHLSLRTARVELVEDDVIGLEEAFIASQHRSQIGG